MSSEKGKIGKKGKKATVDDERTGKRRNALNGKRMA